MAQYNDGNRTNDKNMCIKANNRAKVWVHKNVLISCFVFFEGYLEYKSVTNDENNKIEVDKERTIIDVFMKSAYGNILNEEELKLSIHKNNWFMLFDVIELYDYWCPTDQFDNNFDCEIVIGLIIEYSDSSNICDMLTRLDQVDTNYAQIIRCRLFEKNSLTQHYNGFTLVTCFTFIG